MEDIGEYTDNELYMAILCSQDNRNPQGLVHTQSHDDQQETCMEYKIRSVKRIAREKGWCLHCTRMLLPILPMKGCDECKTEFRHGQGGTTPVVPEDEGHNHKEVPLKDDPRWWNFEDADVMEFWNLEMGYGLDGLSPWSIPNNTTDGSLLERLGFQPYCPICFGVARAFLDKVIDEPHWKGRFALKSFTLRSINMGQAMQPIHRTRLSLKVDVSWWTRYETREWKSTQRSSDLYFVRNNDSEKQGLRHYETKRFNPKYLKLKLQEAFSKSSAPSEDGIAKHNMALPPSFRLIDVKKQCVVPMGNTNVKYSAISYRWDSQDHNMLTESDTLVFSQPGSLSKETMSTTLYDCMMLARDLDIPYIWIDRYCIIQGHVNEKAEQVHAMGNIYTNSWLTIICALFDDIHSGLMGYSKDFNSLQHVPNCAEVYGTADNWKLWRGNRRPEWINRGWTMQEEFLSPRRLYMTEYSVLWHIQCPTIMYHIAVEPVAPQTGLECCLDITEALPDLIRTYSARELTHQGDRVNAIAGLFNARGVEHIHGIGTQNLKFNLAWHATALEPLTSGNSLFPTWSWAHLSQTTWWPFCSPSPQQPRCLILHSRTTMAKRVAFLRRTGCSKNIADKLTENDLIIVSRARRTRPSDEIDLDSDPGTYSAPGAFVIDLFRGFQEWDYDLCWTYSIVVQLFTPSGGKRSGNVVHVRRIGIINSDISHAFKWGKLASLRPAALRRITKWKASRKCRRLAWKLRRRNFNHVSILTAKAYFYKEGIVEKDTCSVVNTSCQRKGRQVSKRLFGRKLPKNDASYRTFVLH